MIQGVRWYLYRPQDSKGIGLENALYVFHFLLCQWCCCSDSCSKSSGGGTTTASTSCDRSSQTREEATRVADKDVNAAGGADNQLEGFFRAVTVCDIK